MSNIRGKIHEKKFWTQICIKIGSKFSFFAIFLSVVY